MNTIARDRQMFEAEFRDGVTFEIQKKRKNAVGIIIRFICMHDEENLGVQNME